MRAGLRTLAGAITLVAAVSLPAQTPGWSSSNGNTTTSDKVGIGVTAPSQQLHVFGKALFQNTSTASVFILDRTDGKIAAMGAGGVSSTFAYDNSGIFKIESSPRSSIATGVFGTAAGAVTRLMIDSNGNTGIGTESPSALLHVAGNARFDGTVTGTYIKAHYQDVAEWVPSKNDLEPGTVVVLDGGNAVRASASPYDTTVAGVVSEQPGIILGQEGAAKEQIATTGRVRVKVDASSGAIAVGDLLVTSERAGYAMKSTPMQIQGRSFHQPGTIIGKALEALPAGSGEILVLLSLQ